MSSIRKFLVALRIARKRMKDQKVKKVGWGVGRKRAVQKGVKGGKKPRVIITPYAIGGFEISSRNGIKSKKTLEKC